MYHRRWTQFLLPHLLSPAMLHHNGKVLSLWTISKMNRINPSFYKFIWSCVVSQYKCNCYGLGWLSSRDRANRSITRGCPMVTTRTSYRKGAAVGVWLQKSEAGGSPWVQSYPGLHTFKDMLEILSKQNKKKRFHNAWRLNMAGYGQDGHQEIICTSGIVSEPSFMEKVLG